MLFTGTAGKQVPRELGCSGSTAHERFCAWVKAGIFERLHAELLRRLNAAGRIDWLAGVIDSTHIRALKGGDLTGPLPVDRGRAGTKHHAIVDSCGVPLAVSVTGGNRNDVTQLISLIDAIGPVAGKRGWPRVS